MPGGTIALVLTIQTNGELLRWNPHLHGLTAMGVFDDDGNFHPLPPPQVEKLSQLFAHKVLAELLKRKLLSNQALEQILSNCSKSVGGVSPPSLLEILLSKHFQEATAGVIARLRASPLFFEQLRFSVNSTVASMLGLEKKSPLAMNLSGSSSAVTSTAAQWQTQTSVLRAISSSAVAKTANSNS